jgi:hypothetical protein
VALILMAEFRNAFPAWQEILYLIGMNIVLPVCVIWFFFGQGLRPVEWLSDQKYNAWNYGFNFKDWKTHLKWAALLIGLLFLILAYHSISIACNYGLLPEAREWPLIIAGYWLVGTCLIWLIFGYMWFGCAQGFGAIAATILTGAAGILVFRAEPSLITEPYSIYFAVFALVGGYVCWKTRSFAPVLYAVLIGAPIITLILWP